MEIEDFIIKRLRSKREDILTSKDYNKDKDEDRLIIMEALEYILKNIKEIKDAKTQKR